MFATGAEGPRFKSRAGQIGHSVAQRIANAVTFFWKKAVLPERNDAAMGPANS